MLGCSGVILGGWLLHGGAGFGAMWTLVGGGGIVVLASGDGGAPGVLGLVGSAWFWSEGYLVPPWRQSLILALMVAIETAIEACFATAWTLFARASASALLSSMHSLHSAFKAAGRSPLLAQRNCLPWKAAAAVSSWFVKWVQAVDAAAADGCAAGTGVGAGAASCAFTGPGADAATRGCSGDIAVPTVLGGGGALTADERILTGIDCKEAAAGAFGGCVAAAAAEQ